MLLISDLSTYSNQVIATIQLLKSMQVKVSNRTINTTLELHPDYPSLLSIHYALPQFNIDTLAIDADKARITEFPLPFRCCWCCFINRFSSFQPLLAFLPTKNSKPFALFAFFVTLLEISTLQ